MSCPNCNAKLQIVRTISAGSAGKTQEAFCDWCRNTYTCVTLILQKSEGYGNGAQAVASQLRRGLIALDKDPQ